MKDSMYNKFENSLWNEKQRLELFGKINPNLSERAEGLLSYWNNFTSKATINNFAFAKEFIKTKGLHEGQAQIRGKQIGFDNKIMMSEFLLKQKNV